MKNLSGLAVEGQPQHQHSAQYPRFDYTIDNSDYMREQRLAEGMLAVHQKEQADRINSIMAVCALIVALIAAALIWRHRAAIGSRALKIVARAYVKTGKTKKDTLTRWRKAVDAARNQDSDES